MAVRAKEEDNTSTDSSKRPSQPRSDTEKESPASSKRRCVSSACIACRRRKSKCDGANPACAACASVYGTECRYDPSSDNRRKGVYKKTIDSLKTRNSTLQTLVQAILNYSEDEVAGLVRDIRSCESLDDVAESILASGGPDVERQDSPLLEVDATSKATFENEMSGKMGELRLDHGSIRFLGGTSNLLFGGSETEEDEQVLSSSKNPPQRNQSSMPVTSWTSVTQDPDLIYHLVHLYFCWHYTFFTTLSRNLFFKDFTAGRSPGGHSQHCSPLLVNAILALGCHFTSLPGARADPSNAATAGDHFFKEAKRLLMENDEHEKPQLTTVQALALMSVREAGCGREAKGWIYSGMSFRMAYDMGLNLGSSVTLDEDIIDARRMTFWGCYLFDKCWSNYLGRQPQLPSSTATVPKIDVFPDEDAALWYPYTDAGAIQARSQPSRTRAVALQISKLCEISNDLLIYFYHPTHLDRPIGKSAELKRLGDIHRRLEVWKKDLPKEMEAREGALPSVLMMQYDSLQPIKALLTPRSMMYHLLFIHLFRPFLKYNQTTTPLPAHVSPRRQCTQAATSISKLLRLYKRSFGLRYSIVNLAVYIAHSACTIHLLNIPDPIAKRDIVYGVRHLEEMADGWPAANRTLRILNILAHRWQITLPDEAAAVLERVSHTEHGRDESSSPNVPELLARPRDANAIPAPPGPAIVLPIPMGPVNISTARAAMDPPTDLNIPARYPPPRQYPPMEVLCRPGGVVAGPNTSSIPMTSALFGSMAGIAQDTSAPPTHDWWLREPSDIFSHWNSSHSGPPLTDVQDDAGMAPATAPAASDSYDGINWYS
ncbi:MAG: hypothetical protein M1823_004856 [Watsoniomyces obsoletus]|nr:MAG: hypothetical protein M1823_004856 [Watsoniomyces obsoletus]